MTSKINQAAQEIYGYSATEIDSTAALWLAERLHKGGMKGAYKAVSRLRERAGKGTAFPAYGTELFASI